MHSILTTQRMPSPDGLSANAPLARQLTRGWAPPAGDPLESLRDSEAHLASVHCAHRLSRAALGFYWTQGLVDTVRFNWAMVVGQRISEFAVRLDAQRAVMGMGEHPETCRQLTRLYTQVGDALSDVQSLAPIVAEALKRDCLAALSYHTPAGVFGYYERYASQVQMEDSPSRLMSEVLRALSWTQRYQAALAADLEQLRITEQENDHESV